MKKGLKSKVKSQKTLDVRPLTLDLKTAGFTREGCGGRRSRCELERAP